MKNFMYIVKAVAANVSPTTFYIETSDISLVDKYIQRKTGKFYQVLSAELVEGICISADE